MARRRRWTGGAKMARFRQRKWIMRNDPSPQETHEPPQGRSGRMRSSKRARRLMGRVWRAARLQWRIAWLRLQLTAGRLLLSAGLLALAALLALASVVYLSVALFQALAMLLPLPLAWLIFGCVHAAAAAILVVIALRILRGEGRK